MVELLCKPETKAIVSVGLEGTPWGRVEFQQYVVIRAVEPELEAELIKMVDVFDRPWPQIDFPYEKKIPGVVKKEFDVDALPVKQDVPTKEEILDPLADKPIIEAVDAAAALKPVVEVPVEDPIGGVL